MCFHCLFFFFFWLFYNHFGKQYVVQDKRNTRAPVASCSIAAFGTFWHGYKTFLSNLTPGWPQLIPHDLWLLQYNTIWAWVPLTTFGCHMVFLSNLIPGWHWLSLHDFWPHQCTTLRSRVLSTKSGGHRTFLRQFKPWLTPMWPLTPGMHFTLVKGSSYQLWWP